MTTCLKRLCRYLAVLGVVWLFSIPLPAPVQAQPAIKNVLLLLSGRFVAPLSVEVDESVRRVFSHSRALNVELYAESLDVARFDAERYHKILAAYLREKYADRKIDLIIPVLPQAARFILSHRMDLFPDTPVVYFLVDERSLDGLVPSPNVTGIHIRQPWKDTLELALAVHPETQRIAVIAGSDVLAKAYLTEAQRAFRTYENRLTFTYLTNRTVPQLLQEVASLPPRTIIIYTTLSADAAGQVYINAEVSGRVAQAANAPVYAIQETYFGRGMVGGYIVDNRAHATRAAEVGLRILAGEKPEDILVGDVSNSPLFDARQLKRWGIAEARLPAGSRVEFRAPSFWEQHRLVILVLVVCLFEGLLIVGLLVHRRLQKAAESKLRDREEQLRLAVNAAALSVWSWDIRRDRIRLGGLARRVLAVPLPDEVGYQEFLSWVIPEDRAPVDTTLQEAIRTGNEFEIEYRIPRADGTVEWIASRGRCAHDHAGSPLRMAGVSQVITERKQVEEELRRHRERLEEMVQGRTAELTLAKQQAEQANTAKTTFLANMSHELRTPLTSILGVAGLLEGDSRLPKDLHQILSRSGKHLLELIEDMLDTSRIEIGQVAIAPITFDLQAFLNDIEATMRLRAGGKDLRLIQRREAPLPAFIRCDARRLRQVLTNLLSNAIRYTERGEVALIVGFRDGGVAAAGDGSGRLAFQVEDTGIGIAAEDLERIFQPFVQLNPGRSASEGTGLGLTLARGLVALLGGQLAVRSTPGSGSCFSFDIPVHVSAQLDGEASSAAIQPRTLAPGQPEYRILVVDDSEDSRSVLRRMLMRAGFAVLESANGQDALDMVARQRPQLVLMDLRMPVMDGYEAVRKIRASEKVEAREAADRLPVIALTAQTSSANGSSAADPAFDAVLCKPFNGSELLDRIGALLGVQYDVLSSALTDQASPEHSSAITSAELEALPVQWVEEFSAVLRKGHSADLLRLIERIRPAHAALAEALAALVHVHAFDRLIAMVEGARKEAVHG